MTEKRVVQMGQSLDEIRQAASRAGGAPKVTAPQEAPTAQQPVMVDPTQPGMVQGVGAAYAQNQQMAGAKGLSDATVQGIEAMQEEQRRRQAEEQEKERIKREAEEADVAQRNEEKGELGALDWRR